MSLLPVAWKIEISGKVGMKGIYDYPLCHELGKAFDTEFTIKIHLGGMQSRRWHSLSQKTISIEIERFCDLKPLSIKGTLSLHVVKTHRRIGFKAFEHDFSDGEKSFTLPMEFFRYGQPFSRVFCDLSLNGHISVDSPNEKDAGTCPVEFCLPPRSHDSLLQLANNYQQMLEDSSFSDITIKCAGESITAHKSVLTLRSPVFKAMFKSDMKESLSNELYVSDIGSEAFRAMLKYMYFNKFEEESMSDILACDLLNAADKYDLPELKEYCVAYLINVISLSNVCRMLEVGLLHDENLKVKAFDFVYENANEILKTDEYKSLLNTHPDISSDILLRMSSKKSKVTKK